MANQGQPWPRPALEGQGQGQQNLQVLAQTCLWTVQLQHTDL